MGITGVREWDEIFKILANPAVSEVEANGPDLFFIKMNGQRKQLDIRLNSAKEYTDGIENGLVPFVTSMNAFDRNAYLFEGRLNYTLNGVSVSGRCHIVLPPTSDTPQITIAKKTASLKTLESIASMGSMSTEMMEFLNMAVKAELSILFSGGTGAGKSVTLDTRIPTPCGWTTMGEIKPGDRIFDRFGNIANVTHKFPQPARQVYELTLATGEKIYADAEHNWVVSSNDSRMRDTENSYNVYTTKELLEAMQEDENESFCIPVLDNPVVFDSMSMSGTNLNTGLSENFVANAEPEELPIHPYVFGLWLGDGSSRDAILYAIHDDANEYNRIFADLGLGENVLTRGYNDVYVHKININGFRSALTALGVRKDNKENKGSDIGKHIPEVYKYSSVESRRLLVAGMLDSDGWSSSNSWSFANKNELLVNGFKEVVHSLGYKSTVYSKTKEDDLGNLYSWHEVRVLTFDKLGKLERKNDNLTTGSIVRRERKIISVVPTDRYEEMACITVDSDDSTYLITDSYIPTHNTTMLEAVAKNIPADTRIGVAEDTPELVLPQLNTTYLHSVPWQPGMDKNDVATLSWVVQQFQRMRMDRIIIGETRGKEFADFLVAANSGMDGSMTTLHADNPAKCLNKMTGFAMKGSEGQPVRSVNNDIANAVNIIVQLIIVDGKHRVSHIQEIVPTLGNTEEAKITSASLYLWDRNKDMFYKENGMTDNLRERITNLGIDVSPFMTSQRGVLRPAHNAGRISQDASGKTSLPRSIPGVPNNTARRSL